jgi:hypothetical protein
MTPNMMSWETLKRRELNQSEKMIVSALPTGPGNEVPVAESIAVALKATVSALDSADVARLMEQELSKLRLLEGPGQWSCEAVRQVADSLFEREIDGAAIAVHVDDVLRCALQNPVLVQFLRAVQSCPAKDLRRKLQEEGASVLPRVLAYSLVLERLSRAMYDDWQVIADCMSVWKRARRAAQIRRHMTPFDHAKMASVESAISRVLGYHARGTVPTGFARFLLPLNIVEACLEDIRLGYRANAACGWALARQRPGRTRDPSTGAGPSRWSGDHKAVMFSMAFPKRWADLYSTWNLAFVSHYGEFPFLMTKLLIPFVADYQQCPEEYIYRRTLALWVHLHYLYLGRADQARTGKGAFVWNDVEVSKLWGRVNREAAREYTATVRRSHSRP